MAQILIIEDDADIRSLYTQILEQAGHHVIEASDGNIGIKLYRENLPDLIITDIIMREKEGLQTIMELRRDFPQAKIIAVSGGGEAMAASTCLYLAARLGAQRTLSKPVSKADFLNAIREVLDAE
ncbi:MAG: response regulator [Desulfomonilaceae bacterium]